VDVRDIAAVAVAALTGSGHSGQTYEITGPEALTFFEIAERLTAVTGRAFTYVPVTEAEFEEMLVRRWGFPDQLAADLAHEYGVIGEGHPAFSTPRDTVPRVTGHQARNIDDFARAYRTELTSSVGTGQ
jgi:uncharacterized protein YbjT (DUF2867 family)